LRHLQGHELGLQSVGDNLDCRFQRLEPLLAITGVNVVSRLVEQTPSTSSFTAGEPSGSRRALRDRSSPCGGTNGTPSSDRARLPAILRTSPSLFVPSFGDKTWDKTPFVRSPIMAEILAFSDAPREPGDGFELSVPRFE
jgi:hypothetical protein